MNKKIQKVQKASKLAKEVNELAKNNQQKPLLSSFIDENGAIYCVAGTFSLEQLCTIKEVINRKIDSMLSKSIKFGADAEKEALELLKGL